MYKILVSDPLEKTGLAMLRESGHQVDELEDRSRLPELLPEYDALVIRSGTKVTADLLEHGERLRVVGRAGIGVDNVDIKAATERGILVVNAPTANLISATEHTFALLLALARRVAAADADLKTAAWNRKKFVGVELQGKTIGVIGFGRIGQQVAKRAQAFDMKVVAFDPFLDADVMRRLDVEPATLDELLPQVDVITFHTPLTPQTRNILSAERIAQLKPGAMVINCGRGGVLDEAALLEALESGHVAGAGLDVFAQEPPPDYALAQHPRVVATPHLGAQTAEAQVRISTETARMVLAALDGSLAVTAVNLPFRPAGRTGEPYLRLSERLAHLASTLLEGGLSSIEIGLWGIDDALHVPITVAALKGALAPFLGEAINYVNAENVAQGRGVEVARTVHSEPADYPHLVSLKLTGSEGEMAISGTLFHGHDPRVVEIQGYQLEFRPKAKLLVVRNHDVPGVVGELGSRLGAAGINIAEIHLSRRPESNKALAVVRLDQNPPDDVLEALRAHEAVRSVQLVELDD